MITLSRSGLISRASVLNPNQCHLSMSTVAIDTLFFVDSCVLEATNGYLEVYDMPDLFLFSIDGVLNGFE